MWHRHCWTTWVPRYMPILEYCQSYSPTLGLTSRNEEASGYVQERACKSCGYTVRVTISKHPQGYGG